MDARSRRKLEMATKAAEFSRAAFLAEAEAELLVRHGLVESVLAERQQRGRDAARENRA